MRVEEGLNEFGDGVASGAEIVVDLGGGELDDVDGVGVGGGRGGGRGGGGRAGNRCQVCEDREGEEGGAGAGQ